VKKVKKIFESGSKCGSGSETRDLLKCGSGSRDPKNADLMRIRIRYPSNEDEWLNLKNLENCKKKT